jgi:hypothetical protein
MLRNGLGVTPCEMDTTEVAQTIYIIIFERIRTVEKLILQFLILYFIPVTRFARSIIPTTHNVLMLRALPTSYQKHKRKEK